MAAFQMDKMLTQIACYAENDEVRVHKQKILETLNKYDEFAVSGLVLPLSVYTEKPELSYSKQRSIVAEKVELERNIFLNELKRFSHSFIRFSVETESAALFQKSTKEECQEYLRQIETRDLCRAFVLYNPWQRDFVMESISSRLQVFLLEDMRAFAQSKQFRLSDCVNAEHKIVHIINIVRQNKFAKQ